MKIFINEPSHKLNIFLLDQNQFTGIGLNENLFKGDKILENVGGHNTLVYDVEFVATELDSRDPGSNCENYGIGYEFETLKECYDRKTEKELEFLGCTLPWFTDNEDNICRYKSSKTLELLIQNNNKQYWEAFVKFYTSIFTDSYFKLQEPM